MAVEQASVIFAVHIAVRFGGINAFQKVAPIIFRRPKFIGINFSQRTAGFSCSQINLAIRSRRPVYFTAAAASSASGQCCNSAADGKGAQPPPQVIIAGICKHALRRTKSPAFCRCIPFRPARFFLLFPFNAFHARMSGIRTIFFQNFLR